MLTALERLIERDVVEVNAAKLRVFSRINPPENLLHDENYLVDQQASEFQVRYGDRVTYRSGLHILGTWSRSRESFLWPWHNSSIERENYLEARERMSAIDELREVLGQVGLSGPDENFFFELCTWIALRCGYRGVYPASFQDDVTVYLAVDLKPLNRDDSGRVCVMCLGREQQAGYFVAASQEFGICSNCIDTLMDVVASHQEEGESLDLVIERKCKAPAPAPALIPCQLCQTARPEVEVIAGPYTGICYHCIQLVADIHREKSQS